jgi:NAD(P)H-hydrate epimerase
MSEANRSLSLPPPPERPTEAHKGSFGTVIVLGGSWTMPGAPAIAARAALRSGAGLVKIGTWAEALATCLTIEPGATGMALPEDGHQLADALDRADPAQRAVLAVGPGLGQSSEAMGLLKAALRGPRAVVLDADGLTLLAETGRWHQRDAAPLVLTPHPGEFRRLAEAIGITASATEPAARAEAATALAQAHHAVVALKGHRTVVSDGQGIYLNDTGGPAMSTAGSGDVLTGLIAALIGQGMGLAEATVLGVHVHGLAGDWWSEQHGPAGMLARELADAIPPALSRVRARG